MWSGCRWLAREQAEVVCIWMIADEWRAEWKEIGIGGPLHDECQSITHTCEERKCHVGGEV